MASASLLHAIVIEDDALMAEVLTTLLEGLNYSVSTYPTAEAFLEASPVELEQPHVMLVDKNLPGMSGIEVVRQHRDRGYRFEAILITGYANVESAIDAVRLGFHSYLPKPFEVEDLIADVSEATARLLDRQRRGASQPRTRVGRGSLRTIRFPVDASGARMPWKQLSTSNLLKSIAQAVEDEYSGTIVVRVEQQPVGTVVMSKGKIAWVSCKDQTENLGSFLWRLGNISRAQLDVVRRTYNTEGGRRRIGGILEEKGYLSRPVLRHCLKLHNEFALAMLFSKPEIEVEQLPERELEGEDEGILFAAEELVPIPVATGFIRSWASHHGVDSRWEQISPENDILNCFVDLPGYIGSAVVSYDGCILVAHFDASAQQPSVFGVLISALLEKTLNLSTTLEIGELEALSLTCSDGVVVGRWVDDARQYFATVLTRSNGDVGQTADRLEAYVGTISAWLAGTQMDQDE